MLIWSNGFDVIDVSCWCFWVKYHNYYNFHSSVHYTVFHRISIYLPNIIGTQFADESQIFSLKGQGQGQGHQKGQITFLVITSVLIS